MYLLTEILISCLLLPLPTASLYVFLSHDMSMKWTKQISSVSHAFWSHTPSDHFKTFSDIFHDGNSHKLALLKEYDAEIKSAFTCNLTVRKHYFDGDTGTKICEVTPPGKRDDNHELAVEKILFLKSDRVFISWKIISKLKGEHTMFKVIFLDTCDSSEIIHLNVSTNMTHNIGRKFYEIIRLEDSFDVIFENFDTCPRGYCKLSFTYNGENITSDSLSFLDEFLERHETFFINSINTIKTESGVGVVMTGKKNQSPSNGRVFVQDAYSPILGWNKVTALSSDYVFVHKYQAYSEENGFATLCWLQIFRKKLSCKWLDDNYEIPIGFGNTLTLEIDHGIRMPHIYNTRDRQIIMMIYGSEDENKFIFIDKVGIDGRCKRLIKIFSKDGSYPQYYLLTVTDQNTFCFSFIMWRSRANKQTNNYVESHTYEYEFVTQCLDIPMYFTPDDITCGTGYL